MFRATIGFLIGILNGFLLAVGYILREENYLLIISFIFLGISFILVLFGANAWHKKKKAEYWKKFKA